MNSNFNRNFAIVSTVILTMLSAIGSASAVTISRPEPSEGCTCMGRYYPAKICRVMRCVDSFSRPRPSKDWICMGRSYPAENRRVMRCEDSLNSFTTSDRRPLDSSLDKTLLSTVTASKNNLLAGRYRTRGPGGGI